MSNSLVCRARRAFTLIELLVVIAIIAILAAILFPVFAQAKAAAKQTVVISGAKQMGTAQLLYATDYDDLFAPVSGFRPDWSMPSFIALSLPYYKSVGIVMDSFSPAKPSDNPFIINSQWAMPPRRDASRFCGATNCGFGVYNSRTRTEITNGQRWYWDGVGGAYREPGTWIWSANAYKDSYPSHSTSSVGRPSETVMLTQANHFDMMWAADWNPDEAFRYWGDGAFNLYGNQNMMTGPAARIRSAAGRKMGIYPTNIASLQEWPEGMNVSVMTDSSAKAQRWRALVSQSVNDGSGRLYMKYFASGVN